MENRVRVSLQWRRCSESSTLETDVYVWCSALWNDADNDWPLNDLVFLFDDVISGPLYSIHWLCVHYHTSSRSRSAMSSTGHLQLPWQVTTQYNVQHRAPAVTMTTQHTHIMSSQPFNLIYQTWRGDSYTIHPFPHSITLSIPSPPPRATLFTIPHFLIHTPLTHLHLSKYSAF